MPDYPHEAIERLRRARAGEYLVDVYPDSDGSEDYAESLLRDDYDTIADYALSVLPSGPKPEAVENPTTGETIWFLCDDGSIGTSQYSRSVDAVRPTLRMAIYRTEADAMLAAEWQAWERYLREKS